MLIMVDPNQIRNFMDYRSFLHAHIDEMKKKNPRWSLGSWSRLLGVNTKSSLIKILQGNRNAGPKITEAFISYFDFSKSDAQYFRDLVQLEKLKKNNRISSSVLLNELQKEKLNPMDEGIDDQTLVALTHWYYPIVMTLLMEPKSNQEPEALAKKIGAPLNAETISIAIEHMLAIGLLKKSRQGRLSISKKWQALRPVRLFALSENSRKIRNNFHREMLNRTAEIIADRPIMETDARTLCLTMSQEKMDQARDLIDEFTTKFFKLCEEKDSDSIFQLQIQLLPVTAS